MSDALRSLTADLAGLAEQVGGVTVRVEGRGRMPATGVVYSADGLIVTSHHVVEREDNLAVGLPDGRRVAAQLVGRDATSDLALLRAEATGLLPAQWAAADELRVGHLVLALGRPGQSVQATLGVISALNGSWRTPGGGQIERYVRTDVVMYPGFSGGPLAGAGGQVIGVNTSALLRGESIAVPGETVRRVAATLLEHGRMPRGYLGVGLQPVRLAPALHQQLGQETGLMIMSVEADAPAAAAGIVQGDILVALDGQAVRHIDGLQSLLGAERVGKQVEARLVRGGAPVAVTVTIGQQG